METLFTRPLNWDLTEATEPIQATRCTAAATQCSDSASERVGRLAFTLGVRGVAGLTVFWKPHELRGLAGKADPPGVAGTDSELIRAPGTEVFDDEVSVQGRSYRLLPGLGP